MGEARRLSPRKRSSGAFSGPNARGHRTALAFAAKRAGPPHCAGVCRKTRGATALRWRLPQNARGHCIAPAFAAKRAGPPHRAGVCRKTRGATAPRRGAARRTRGATAPHRIVTPRRPLRPAKPITGPTRLQRLCSATGLIATALRPPKPPIARQSPALERQS